MRIVVNNKYTYDCPFHVCVGDRLRLPTGSGTGEWVGTVTGFESDYHGPLKSPIGFEDGRSAEEIKRFRSIFDEWEPSCLSLEWSHSSKP